MVLLLWWKSDENSYTLLHVKVCQESWRSPFSAGLEVTERDLPSRAPVSHSGSHEDSDEGSQDPQLPGRICRPSVTLGAAVVGNQILRRIFVPYWPLQTPEALCGKQKKPIVNVGKAVSGTLVTGMAKPPSHPGIRLRGNGRALLLDLSVNVDHVFSKCPP